MTKLSQSETQKAIKADKLHLGCGLTAPPGWLNVDGSWQVTMTQLPYFRHLLGFLGIIPWKQATIPWPDNVLRIDLRKNLPLPNNTFVAVYSSHLLEHLYRDECVRLLRECYRVLKPGGVCRAVVPDLDYLVHEYLKSKKNQTDPSTDPARNFIRSLHLRDESVPRGSILYRLYQQVTDFHTHKWMYDRESLVLIFQEAGFQEVEPMNFLASRIEDIEQVEKSGRVENGQGICIEGVRPNSIRSI